MDKQQQSEPISLLESERAIAHAQHELADQLLREAALALSKDTGDV